MKLQPDQSDAQTITGYGPGWVGVGQEKITHNVVLGSRGERFEWAGSFEELGPEHFAQLAQLEVEVVIFGSGRASAFRKPAWLAPLMRSGASASRPWTRRPPAAPTTSWRRKAARSQWPCCSIAAQLMSRRQRVAVSR